MTAITPPADAPQASPPAAATSAHPTSESYASRQQGENPRMSGRASDGELLRKAEKYEEIYNELVELRKKEATTADRNKKLEAQVGRLKTAHETAERQRTALIQEREHYKKANAEVRDEVAKLTKRLRECEHIRGDLEATQKQLGELSLELNHLRMAYDDKKALLDTRTLELHEMRAFVDKSDAVSCGDVQRMLEHLNEQIFQLAALVTDGTPFGDSPRNDRDVRAVYAKVERWLGRPTADMLSCNLHADDPSLAQIGLQAVASELAAWIICAWDVNLDDPLNSLLTNIHEAIFLQEPQAISARWRILARRYAKELAPSPDVVADATSHLLDSLHYVLRLCNARGITDRKAWDARFADKARDIVLQSMTVQKAIGEDVASTDFQLVCPADGTRFNATEMQDVNECGRGKLRNDHRGRVLCTTAIGLRRCEKITSESGVIQVNAVTVVKAKVVLQT